eukprot:s1_g685.t1
MTHTARMQFEMPDPSSALSPMRNLEPPVARPPVSGRDLMVLGAAVTHFGRGLSEDVLTALSWAMLNRRSADDGTDLEHSAQAAEHWATALLADPLDRETARALAVFAQVLTGGVADPTDGASRFHCHDETPKWAAEMDIRAIVGPYLFYASKPKD